MAQIFVIVRLAVLIMSAISLVLSIIGLIDVLGAGQSGAKTQSIVSHCVIIAVLFLGAYGSYINNRTYLYTFALIAFIGIIVEATAFAYYVSMGFVVVLIVLAVSQAELLRRGHA